MSFLNKIQTNEKFVVLTTSISQLQWFWTWANSRLTTFRVSESQNTAAFLNPSLHNSCWTYFAPDWTPALPLYYNWSISGGQPLHYNLFIVDHNPNLWQLDSILLLHFSHVFITFCVSKHGVKLVIINSEKWGFTINTINTYLLFIPACKHWR